MHSSTKFCWHLLSTLSKMSSFTNCWLKFFTLLIIFYDELLTIIWVVLLNRFLLWHNLRSPTLTIFLCAWDISILGTLYQLYLNLLIFSHYNLSFYLPLALYTSSSCYRSFLFVTDLSFIHSLELAMFSSTCLTSTVINVQRRFISILEDTIRTWLECVVN